MATQTGRFPDERELPEHPTPVPLKLVGESGNAFAILAAARKAARRAGWSTEQIEEYTETATAGDYNDLLRVTMEWFEVE